MGHCVAEDACRASVDSLAACALTLVAPEHASGFARLPDCLPAPYGSVSV